MNSAQREQAWKPADLAFLATAMLLHAILLLLPLKPWQNPAPTDTPRLTIDLQQLPPPVRTGESEATPPAKPVAQQPEPEPVSPARRTPRIALDELPEAPELPPASATTTEPELLTTRQLRDLVNRTELQQQATDAQRQLGSVRPYQPPSNWNRNAGAPYLAEFDNRFNGMTAPEEVEIVDRWTASDGSHNVVLNLPNGDTICGRAEAFNPMQPLVEPIMMFRSCGGGGKRTFSMPDRYNKGR